MNVNEPIKSAAKATEGVQPGIGSLHWPACFSKTAAVFGVAFGNDRRDSQPTQNAAQRFGIIAAVALQPIGEMEMHKSISARCTPTVKASSRTTKKR